MKFRDTTFFHRQFTLSTSVSVRQHSGACNVRYYVAAYYLQLPRKIRCKAQGCIPKLFPTRLSSTGNFLCVSQSCTCSRHSLLNTSITSIIDIKSRECQLIFVVYIMRNKKKCWYDASTSKVFLYYASSRAISIILLKVT